MIVNLENLSYMTVSGMRVELHFKDSSTYMNRFGSVGEMLAALKDWQEKTRILHGDSTAPRREVSLPRINQARKRKNPAVLSRAK